MKDIFNKIKSNFSLRTNELRITVVISVFCFIIGHIMLRLIMEFDKSVDMTSFELGTVLTAMITFLTTIAMGANNYSNHINYALSMGKRRRDIITAHIVVALIKSFVATSLIYIYHEIESYICRTSYKGIPEDFDFDKLFTFEIFFVILIALIALETFMGSMLTRFGQKTFWIMWVICVLGFSFIPSAIEHTVDGTATGITAAIGQFIIDVFTGLNMNTILIGICILSIILISMPYILLRKHRVTL